MAAAAVGPRLGNRGASGISMMMQDGKDAPPSPPLAAREYGLCAGCVHARRIRSDRGSTFLLCQLSLVDQRFPKYPRLPVLACGGYQKRSGDG
ncbi:MAG: hypothetical protein ABSF59_01745 [Candidatus Sulfotelmatobacter sp.]|jgi:hypothetical protein